MENKITIDSILQWFKESVEQKRTIDAHTWVDGMQKLNILLGDENNKLYDLQQEVARLKIIRIEAGDSVAKARTYVEATDEYKEMKKQQAKIELVLEAVKIAKIQARLNQDNLKGY